MANSKLILKNTTITDIELDEGFTIPASSQIEIDPSLRHRFWDDIDVVGLLATKIRAGDVVVNDGINDLIAERGIDFLKFSDRAFNLRFESDPERVNGFVSKNVQEAIEEARAAIEGKVSVLPTFLNNGLTKNKWLALDGAMNPSNELPAVTSYDARLASFTFVNDKVNTDTNIELYVNGVLTYTWFVRNAQYAWKTSGLSGVVFDRGDRISCFARQVTDHTSNGGDGTGTDPSSVVIFINVQTINSVNDEGSGKTLLLP